MKIAVMGGTGLIGSQVVKILNASGHEAVPHSRSTGVDLLSGRGLPGALKGADVVVDVTNSPTFDDASVAFFQTTSDNLRAAAAEAGVGHAVLLSIVGADLVPGLVYYRGKVLQEDVLKSGSTPYSIVRATQFFEFIERRCPSAPTRTRSACHPPSSSRSPRPTSPRRWPTSARARRCRAPATLPGQRSSGLTSWAGSPSPRAMTIAPSSPTTRPACSPPSRATR